jgi:hypothetical protein
MFVDAMLQVKSSAPVQRTPPPYNFLGIGRPERVTAYARNDG